MSTQFFEAWPYQPNRYKIICRILGRLLSRVKGCDHTSPHFAVAGSNPLPCYKSCRAKPKVPRCQSEAICEAHTAIPDVSDYSSFLLCRSTHFVAFVNCSNDRFDMARKENPLLTAEKPHRPSPAISGSTRKTFISALIRVLGAPSSCGRSTSIWTVEFIGGHMAVKT
jgi:hypothetical protein